MKALTFHDLALLAAAGGKTPVEGNVSAAITLSSHWADLTAQGVAAGRADSPIILQAEAALTGEGALRASPVIAAHATGRITAIGALAAARAISLTASATLSRQFNASADALISIGHTAGPEIVTGRSSALVSVQRHSAWLGTPMVVWGTLNYGQQSQMPKNRADKPRLVACGTGHLIVKGGAKDNRNITAYSWAKNDFGQAAIPTQWTGPNGSTIAILPEHIIEASAGSDWTVALVKNTAQHNTVIAFGLNASGQCNVPATFANGEGSLFNTVIRLRYPAASGFNQTTSGLFIASAVLSVGTTGVPAQEYCTPNYAIWGSHATLVGPPNFKPASLWGGYGRFAWIDPTVNPPNVGGSLYAPGSPGSLVVAHPGTWKTPVPFSDLYGVNNLVKVALGREHVLGLTDDGLVFGARLDINSAIGGHTSTWASKPPPMVNEIGAVDIAAGSEFSAAALRDGTVVVWGDGQYAFPVMSKASLPQFENLSTTRPEPNRPLKSGWNYARLGISGVTAGGTIAAPYVAAFVRHV